MGKNNKLFRERMKAIKPDIEEIAYMEKEPKKVEKAKKKAKGKDKPVSKYCQNVFARKDAERAEQKRKEKYLKEVYKKIEEENLTR